MDTFNVGDPVWHRHREQSGIFRQLDKGDPSTALVEFGEQDVERVSLNQLEPAPACRP